MMHERQQQILKILHQQGFASVEELCQILYSSGATIRRDLNELENRGMLKRVHGGAIAFSGINSDLPFMLRSNSNVNAKKYIAKLASQFARDSMTLFLDSGSTTKHLAQEIINCNNLSVITNSLETAHMLSTNSDIKVYASGGCVRNNTTMVGSYAFNMVNDRYADIFFFSCAGASIVHGTSETNEDNVQIKRAMFANSTKRILLCDHTKFGTFFSYKCFEWKSIDVLITDQKPSDDFIEKLPPSTKLLY